MFRFIRLLNIRRLTTDWRVKHLSGIALCRSAETLLRLIFIFETMQQMLHVVRLFIYSLNVLRFVSAASHSNSQIPDERGNKV